MFLIDFKSETRYKETDMKKQIWKIDNRYFLN